MVTSLTLQCQGQIDYIFTLINQRKRLTQIQYSEVQLHVFKINLVTVGYFRLRLLTVCRHCFVGTV